MDKPVETWLNFLMIECLAPCFEIASHFGSLFILSRGPLEISPSIFLESLRVNSMILKILDLYICIDLSCHLSTTLTDHTQLESVLGGGAIGTFGSALSNMNFVESVVIFCS